MNNWSLHNWGQEAILDRADDARTAERLAELWADPRARLVEVDWEGQFRGDREAGRIEPVDTTGEYDEQRHVFLGLLEGVPYFAVTTILDTPTVAIRKLLGRAEGGELEVITSTAAILNWHRSGGYCVSCGKLTQRIRGGYARICPNCDWLEFPRTDPAVIVSIIDDDDRILLAHQGTWDEGRYSVLAGFVEAGQSFEQTCFREVLEESGIHLREVKYMGSQPWPFPRSIMIGFEARAATTEIKVDGEEIVHAAWFTRDELARAVEAGTVKLPFRGSIAAALIDRWRYPAASAR
ncbi:NAD(+) diphosphatase [Granulicoccus phenolivorans]|uniref:NAD(+) diphosphatase n=1 Tax=Granulicoccus phenolivorans TaxID=266854 RepID=UPI0004253C8D|nr:NAD(+) diphosphatase [Granulicoccus phenolivorans]